MNLRSDFSRFANGTAHAAGSPWAFVLCVLIVVSWALSGPLFAFSDTWQLVINTGTTIVTFLMVFLIQNTQNRDNMAIQAKLDELILTSKAENEFVGIEKLTDKELEALQARCHKQAEKHRQFVEHVEKERASRLREADDGKSSRARTKSARPRTSAAGHASDAPPSRRRSTAPG